jgi:hypothetical protein
MTATMTETAIRTTYTAGDVSGIDTWMIGETLVRLDRDADTGVIAGMVDTGLMDALSARHFRGLAGIVARETGVSLLCPDAVAKVARLYAVVGVLRYEAGGKTGYAVSVRQAARQEAVKFACGSGQSFRMPYEGRGVIEAVNAQGAEATTAELAQRALGARFERSPRASVV